MKTKEELDALKEEVAILNKKLNELTEEELEQVAGGLDNSNATVALKVIDNALQRALNQ